MNATDLAKRAFAGQRGPAETVTRSASSAAACTAARARRPRRRCWRRRLEPQARQVNPPHPAQPCTDLPPSPPQPAPPGGGVAPPHQARASGLPPVGARWRAGVGANGARRCCTGVVTRPRPYRPALHDGRPVGEPVRRPAGVAPVGEIGRCRRPPPASGADRRGRPRRGFDQVGPRGRLPAKDGFQPAYEGAARRMAGSAARRRLRLRRWPHTPVIVHQAELGKARG